MHALRCDIKNHGKRQFVELDETKSDNCEVDVYYFSKEEQLALREELSQIEKILKMREDACIEKEREITLREQELERKKRAIATERHRQTQAAEVERKIWREEEEHWRREVRVKHIEQERLKKLAYRESRWDKKERPRK